MPPKSTSMTSSSPFSKTDSIRELLKFSSRQGRGIQNKSFGSSDKNDGEAGLSTFAKAEEVGNDNVSGHIGKADVAIKDGEDSAIGEAVAFREDVAIGKGDDIIKGEDVAIGEGDVVISGGVVAIGREDVDIRRDVAIGKGDVDIRRDVAIGGGDVVISGGVVAIGKGDIAIGKGDDGKDKVVGWEPEDDFSNNDFHLAFSTRIDSSLKGPLTLSSGSESGRSIEEHGTSSSSAIGASINSSVLVLASDVSIKTRFSVQTGGINTVLEFPVTSTTSPEGNKTENDRLISSFADKLTLTEGAAILSDSLEERKGKTKILCSNSNSIMPTHF